MMASKITDQVRDIAAVAKAVAEGDLSKKVTANAQGEVLELKNTMNRMVNFILQYHFFISLFTKGRSTHKLFCRSQPSLARSRSRRQTRWTSCSKERRRRMEGLD